VQVYGLPASANAIGPIMLAMDAGVGGMEFCNIMEGAQMKPEFLAMNPFHHVPTLQAGAFAIGETSAIIRHLAMQYKPEYYPVGDPATCGIIDFAMESFTTELYPKVGYQVMYPVFGYAGPPDDQAKANKETLEVIDTWMKHFVKGKFVCGDKISAADFRAVPFFFAVMQPAVEANINFKLPDRVKQYVEDFMKAVDASAMMKEAQGYSLAEYAATKNTSAKPSTFTPVQLPAAPSFGKSDGKKSVKVYGMPASANSVGPILLAMDAKVGGMEMCNLMNGDHMKPEFLAMNPFHHIPTIKDGDLAIGESLACLRYLAIAYKPEYYPVTDAMTCGMIDFAMESFSSEVYPKIGPGVFYPVFEFCKAPADQNKANQEATEAVDTWMKHFVTKGDFVCGNRLSIADFKAVPFFFAVMQPSVASKTQFTLPTAAQKYVKAFCDQLKEVSSFMETAGGYSLKEYAASKA
jgi:glutathione S-transferase